MLAQYQYELLYRPGPSIANADGLSKLPLPDMPKDLKCPPELVYLLKQLQTAPIDHRQLKKWTVRDPLLSNVSRLVQEQWRVHCPDWTKWWKSRCSLVLLASRYEMLQHKLFSALGSGLEHPGLAFPLTMQGLSLERCSCWFWMLTPNGLKCSQSALQTQQQQLSISGKCSVLMVFPLQLYQTMQPSS